MSGNFPMFRDRSGMRPVNYLARRQVLGEGRMESPIREDPGD